MEFELLGWPEDAPTLELDHRAFSYAGKFVMSNTGKAVVRDGGAILAAVSFNPDRTDERHMWLRYLSVRRDRRGEGVGTRLAVATRERILERGYEKVSIAVNNPFAYVALYRAGFAYTGRETGIAELVLSYPDPQDPAQYRDGLDVFRERASVSEAERAFLESRSGEEPPSTIEGIASWVDAR